MTTPAARSLKTALDDLRRVKASTGQAIAKPAPAPPPRPVEFKAVEADAWQRDLDARRRALARSPGIQHHLDALAGMLMEQEIKHAPKTPQKATHDERSTHDGTMANPVMPKPPAAKRQKMRPRRAAERRGEDAIIAAQKPQKRPQAQPTARRQPSAPARPQASPYAHLGERALSIWRYIDGKSAVTVSMISEALAISFSEVCHELRRLENNALVRFSVVGWSVTLLISPPAARAA